jgi:hypothetical protein
LVPGRPDDAVGESLATLMAQVYVGVLSMNFEACASSATSRRRNGIYYDGVDFDR